MPASAAVFLVVASDPERLLRAGLWAVAAASVGERVQVLLAAPALAAVLDDPPGPRPAEALGLPRLRALLEDARALGAKVVTCDTEVALSGREASAIDAVVDEVVPLASFWRETQGARVVVV